MLGVCQNRTILINVLIITYMQNATKRTATATHTFKRNREQSLAVLLVLLVAYLLFHRLTTKRHRVMPCAVCS